MSKHLKTIPETRATHFRYVDGIWISDRKATLEYTSQQVMQTVRTHIDRDVVLTAITVIPGTAVWIMSERVWAGLLAALISFVAIEYGIPAWLRGELTKAHLLAQFEEYKARLRALLPARLRSIVRA